MDRTGWKIHGRLVALGSTFLMESLCHLLRIWPKLHTGEILCWHSKLKHQIYSCSAESENECLSFWNKIMGRSGCRKTHAQPECTGLRLACLKSSEINLHLWNLSRLRCKGAELCSGQVSSIKCILWTQQIVPAPGETAKAGEIIFLSMVLHEKEKSQLNTLPFMKSSKKNGFATISHGKGKSQRQYLYMTSLVC